MTDLEPAAPPLPALPADQRPAADPYEVYLASLQSPESKRTMRSALDHIARMQTGNPDTTGAWQPWWLLRYEHTTKIREALVERGYSRAHVNKHLVALRRVLRVCWRMGLMSADEYERARDIENVAGKRLPAGRDIPPHETAAMLRVCAETEGPAGVRDAAMLAVLFAAGLRRAEIAGALLERYDPRERSLKVIGKRDNERLVYITPSAAALLNRWLHLLGERRGPMFRPIDKHGNALSAGMTPRAVGYIVDRTRRRAALPPLSTHDFRRTYTGDLLDAGVDLATAQKLLGHASPTTTALYDRRPDRRLKEASDRLTLPAPEGQERSFPFSESETIEL